MTLLADPIPQASILGQFDHVTLLPNRLRFTADLQRTEAEDATRPNRALILITLAEAQHYNSILRALGHGFADDFVRLGAAMVQAALPDGIALYHVSVLSFAFVLTTDSMTAIPPLAHDLARLFNQPITCQDIPISTRIGVGVYTLPIGRIMPAEALRGALAAAQDSRSRPEGVARYNRLSDMAHQRSFTLLSDLRQALTRNGELALHYQPRVNLATGHPESAEALIRWTHPTLGPVSPGEFIPLVETTALMQPLTDWILSTAFQQQRSWSESGQMVKLSLNIAPTSLRDPNFVERMATMMHGFGVSPDLVELEFTESSLTSSEAHVLRQIDEIRAHGVAIAIDDFGTGYSNLNTLTQLPAQVLKIDRCFIQNIETNRGQQSLVRAIIDMAHGQHYRVVAEGIESQACYQMLADWGCEEGQGYHISRPLPELGFSAWRQAKRQA
jgi:EAL domain-containing protein (putative c-di-GMP-specific phosphodiesterase class I)/GGDEF domain-containing protein